MSIGQKLASEPEISGWFRDEVACCEELGMPQRDNVALLQQREHTLHTLFEAGFRIALSCSLCETMVFAKLGI